VFTNNLANTVHLHATHGIVVIGVDEFNIFIHLSIKYVLFLCADINVRFAALERTMTRVFSLEKLRHSRLHSVYTLH
jgi:hypothetical protein